MSAKNSATLNTPYTTQYVSHFVSSSLVALSIALILKVIKTDLVDGSPRHVNTMSYTEPKKKISAPPHYILHPNTLEYVLLDTLFSAWSLTHCFTMRMGNTGLFHWTLYRPWVCSLASAWAIRAMWKHVEPTTNEDVVTTDTDESLAWAPWFGNPVISVLCSYTLVKLQIVKITTTNHQILFWIA